MASSLPLELFHRIIDELSSDEDWRTLGSCALTCHALRPVCQAHLYSLIQFTAPEQRPDSSAAPAPYHEAILFLDIVSDNPDICQYVLALRLERFGCYGHSRDLEWLPAVLAKLSHLNELIFRLCYGFAEYPEALLDAFAALGQRRTLRKLTISRTSNLSLSFVALFPNLTSLGLVCTILREEEKGGDADWKPTPGHVRPRLFEFRGHRLQNQLVEKLSLMFDFDHVRKLDIECSIIRTEKQISVLCAKAPLEELSLDVEITSVPELKLGMLSSLTFHDPGLLTSIDVLPAPERLQQLSFLIWGDFFGMRRIPEGIHDRAKEPNRVIVHHILGPSLSVLNNLLPSLSGLRTITAIFHTDPLYLFDVYNALLSLLPNAAVFNVDIEIKL